ncbi:MAG: PLP-dependent cysteine synthase family protein [Candidatus Aenigmarchaeota archaeon]|nr:PLP-dependent cysteine synthase family protein [Candidatus Aenigmarchaeota archaeon]
MESELTKQKTCNIKQNVMGLVGNTPMIRISNILSENSAEIYAKLEWYNIGSSVKDRVALRLIENAEKKGRLSEGKIILEATSGNTGISLAMIAAAKGYPIELTMSECVSIERRKIITAYGAKLILSPGEKGTGGAVELKYKMLKENPDKYVDVDQFGDPANIEAHYDTTAKEILEQTDSNVDMVVLGIGTAGTGVGISKRLKEHNPEIKMIAVIPAVGAVIQGLRNPCDMYPTRLYNSGYFDEVIEIKKDEIPKTYAVARELAKKEGLLVGMSSGAVMYVARNKAKEIGDNKKIVVIFPDNGFKYLSTPLFG